MEPSNSTSSVPDYSPNIQDLTIVHIVDPSQVQDDPSVVIGDSNLFQINSSLPHHTSIVGPETSIQENCAPTEEQDYDEALVYVEFSGIAVNDALNQPNPDFKIIGLLENEPKIQLGGQVYAGTLDDTIGTYLFFEETSDPPKDFDPDFNQMPEKWFKYDCKTSKELTVKRIYTKKKSLHVSKETENTTTEQAMDTN